MKSTIRNHVGRSTKEARSTQPHLTSQAGANNAKRSESGEEDIADTGAGENAEANDDTVEPNDSTVSGDTAENGYQKKTGQIKRDQFRE
jgi:hypothetical protein